MHCKSTKQRRSYHRRRAVVAPLEVARLKAEAEEKLRNYRASLALAGMFGAPPAKDVHTTTVRGRLSAKTDNLQTLSREQPKAARYSTDTPYAKPRKATRH